MKHPDVWLAPGLAILLATLGMATLPIAIHHEATAHHVDLMLTMLPYVVGMVIGIVLWLSIERTRFDPTKVHPLYWLGATVAALMLPLAWPTDYGRHQYPFEVDPILVGLPFFAAFITGLSKRMGHDAPTMAWLCVLGGAGLLNLASWMGAILIPSFHVLLFPALLLLAQNATLRRIGMVSVAGAALVLALILIDRPFMFFRILNAMTPSMTMWQDPLGVGYQSTHIWQILHSLSWFGTNLDIHLPEATRQLLPVVVANRFGGLALVGLFGLIAFWFYLTRPTRQSDTPLDRLGDMVWWALLYFAILNMGGNLLVIGLFGPGMPIFGSNPALLALALLVVAIRAQRQTVEALSQRTQLIVTSAWTVLLALAVAVMSQAATAPTAQLPTHVAEQALDRAMADHKADRGAVVILDAESGAAVAMVEKRRDENDPIPMYVNFAPGHTLTPFLAAALIDRGVLRPDSVISSKSLVLPDGTVIRDDHPIQNGATVREILAHSSRVGTARLASMLPSGECQALFSRLGIESRISANETVQALAGLATPGGSIEVDLTELAQAYLALAGGDVPRLADIGNLPTAKRLQREFSPDTEKEVRVMLANIVYEMDAQRAFIGYQVAGKANTIVTPLDAKTQRHTAMFVGIAPLDRPRYVVAVLVERDGNKKLLAVEAAEPVIARIIGKLLPDEHKFFEANP